MLTIKCPSKLNLNLRVIKKRSDGMHDIESRFQLINLYDEIRIKRNKSKNNSIKTTLGNSLNDKNNIVFSAIEALQNYTNIDIFCEIFIKKNIPVSGGMGGGSSNAAAALVGINNLYSLNLSPLELMKIGKKLGADVPFFLFGKNAIAQGIGDNLSIKPSINKKFLVLCPDVKTSTKKMFLKWDKINQNESRNNINPDENSFLTLFLDENKPIKKVFNEINKITPLKLSGTGSTLFYAYNELNEIEETLKKIPTKWRHFFCEPLQCSPLLTYIK